MELKEGQLNAKGMEKLPCKETLKIVGPTHCGEKTKGKMGHYLQHLESCESRGNKTSIHHILQILVWGALPHLKQTDQFILGWYFTGIEMILYAANTDLLRCNAKGGRKSQQVQKGSRRFIDTSPIGSSKGVSSAISWTDYRN